MVNLKRPDRDTRNSGFSMRYLSLLIAATMALVLWAYQRIYFEKATPWLLVSAIVLAVLAFSLAIYNIIRAWRKHKG